MAATIGSMASGAVMSKDVRALEGIVLGEFVELGFWAVQKKTADSSSEAVNNTELMLGLPDIGTPLASSVQHLWTH